ncbi:MAG: hypothetical protein OYH76_18315 [Defluviicoccus sp.]|nr:hypothetical protein [Defluviicoccus sp.]MDE0277853.1 hypothetical protein [Defluviicoccus sp.]
MAEPELIGWTVVYPTVGVLWVLPYEAGKSTGVTRGKRLVLVGQRKAVAIAVRNASGRPGKAPE